jgi:hypothetical protein
MRRTGPLQQICLRESPYAFAQVNGGTQTAYHRRKALTPSVVDIVHYSPAVGVDEVNARI